MRASEASFLSSRREFMKQAMLLVAAGGLARAPAFGQQAATAAARRPNFIFILADDLGSADVGWRGSPIRTPNLDRLALAGVRLEAHYTAPVCSPTRAGLLTGRYWSRFGITVPNSRQCLPDGTPTLASVLREAGYRTAITGKWHLGGAELPNKRPGKFGFEVNSGVLDGAANPFTHVYTHGGKERAGEQGIKTWHRNGEIVDEQGHITDLIARDAVAFIRESKDRPFFLYVPFTAPHERCLETPEWMARAAACVPEPQRQAYAAMVMHMDDAVGKIVAALDTEELRRNTLVVFASDNGGVSQGLNTPYRAKKATVYEGGVRNLAFANWPGRLSPAQRAEPACVTDWMPTFCALAGARPAKDPRWDGRDLWPLLAEGKAPGGARAIYLRGLNGRSAALRAGDWKLVLTQGPQGETAELFDLAADPGESRDLAAEQPARVAELRARLRAEGEGDNGDVAPEVLSGPGTAKGRAGEN
jgi:arylsulfatase A-like enzyme